MKYKMIKYCMIVLLSVCITPSIESTDSDIVSCDYNTINQQAITYSLGSAYSNQFLPENLITDPSQTMSAGSSMSFNIVSSGSIPSDQ